jgi:hypothetical protein
MSILETQLVQRAYDGRWEKIARVKDHENAYTYTNELGIKTTDTPDKWMTIAVFDAIMEIE